MNAADYCPEGGSGPVYKQLAAKILSSIEGGKIKRGGKLPSERQLADLSGLSRGTVKKAYDMLRSQRIVMARQGGGTFVSTEGNSSEVELSVIGNRLDSMCGLGFSERELKSVVNILLDERYSARKCAKVAAIECNEETLDIIRQQMSGFDTISLYQFLLDELRGFKKPGISLDVYDFIFTTTTHYNEIREMIPECSQKLIQASLSPDVETIVGLKAVPDDAKVGIIVKSRRFLEIVTNFLTELSCSFDAESVVLSEDGKSRAAEFIRSKDVLILPPIHAACFDSELEAELRGFRHRGGKIVGFNYNIEKGSLIYIEERAKIIKDAV